ncbi:MAG: hypothetical protein ACR2IV_10315 [Bryobacteraceae bacterium]
MANERKATFDPMLLIEPYIEVRSSIVKSLHEVPWHVALAILDAVRADLSLAMTRFTPNVTQKQ